MAALAASALQAVAVPLAPAASAAPAPATTPLLLLPGATGDTGGLPFGGAAFAQVSGTGSAYQPTVSSDGHYVAYADALGSNPAHIYLVNTESPTSPVLLDRNPAGASGNAYSYAPAISGDGRYVAFNSWATDLAGDGAGDGVFVADTQSGTVTRVSVDGAGAPIDGDPVAGGPSLPGFGDGADPVNGPAISADGRYVVFLVDDPACDNYSYQTTDQFGDAITAGAPDGGAGYVWDRTTGTTTRIPGCVRAPAISADGSLVVYDTGDANGVFHVYGWDTATGTSVGVLSLGSQGDVKSGRLPSVSADGNKIAFVTGPGLGWFSGYGPASEQGDVRWASIAVYDRTTKTTYTASHPAGDGFLGISDLVADPRVSADGRYVTYMDVGPTACFGAIAASGKAPLPGFGVDIPQHVCGPIESNGVYVADMTTSSYAEMDLGYGMHSLPQWCLNCVTGEPAISSDGSQVAYVAVSGTGAKVYMRDRTQTPTYVPPAELLGADSFCPICDNIEHRLDPINTATGAYQRQDNDASLPGTGVTFGVDRHYSSDNTAVGPFGTGWSANLGSSLQVLASGDVQVSAGSGSQVTFVHQPDGSYASPPEVRATLSASASGGWELTSANQLTTAYDASGRMVSQTDRNGQGLAYGYDAQGRLSSVADAAGRTATVTYGSSGAATGMISAVGLSDGRTWSYGYVLAADGTTPLLSAVTDPTGAAMTYAYDPSSKQLTSVTDANGNVEASIAYAYDSEVSQLTEASNTGGTHGSYQWSSSGGSGNGTARTTDADGGTWTDLYAGNNLISQTDPLGNTTTYTYDDHDNRTSVVQPDGATTTYTYDAAGNVLSQIDPDGDITTYTYDAHNDLLTETDARGNTTTFTYDADGDRTSETDAAGGLRSWTYDSAGRALTETDPNGNTTTYAYDAAGNLASETDALGRTTSYAYDSAGRLLTTTDPNGGVTAHTYDAAGRLLTETDPMGRETDYTYDPAGNVVTETTAAGTPLAATTSYAYDAANHPLTTTDPLGRVTTNTYDAVGNLISTTDPAGDTTSYAYDTANRKVSQTSPLGNEPGANATLYTTNYSYDRDGRVVDVFQHAVPGDSLDTTTEYDAAGRAVATIDPVGNVSTRSYDPTGNVVSSTDGSGATTTYSYDSLNRLASQTDPLGRTSLFGYDADGNRTSMTDPAGGTTTYAYDAANEQVAMVAPDGNVAGGDPSAYTTRYANDGNGNTVSVTDPLGNATTYAYDADNERTSATDPTGAVTTYAYDAAGRLVTTTQPDGTATTDAYDLAGEKLSSTDSAGDVTTYAYDAAGRMTGTTDPTGAVTSYAFDANGDQVSSTSPNGGVTTNAYDAAGRLVSVTDPLNHVTTYGYDADGRKTSVTDADGNVTQYTYDGAGRLIDTLRADGTHVGNTYDAAGETTAYVDAAGNSTSYTYDAAGRVASQTDADGRATSFGYDASGNQVNVTDAAGRVTTQSFDANNRLGSIHYSDGNTPGVTYSYDAAGRRLSMVDGSGTTSYGYDGAGQLTTATKQTAGSGSGGSPADGCGVCVLDAVGPGALSLSGTASVTSSGAVTVDSAAPDAIRASGSAQVSGSAVFVTGGVRTSGRAGVSPDAETGSATDPLASAAPPSASGSPSALVLSGRDVVTAAPGVYSSISVSGRASLTLSPGTYVLAGGDLSLSGSATVTGDGVTLVLGCAGYPAPCGQGESGAGLHASGTASLSLDTGAAASGVGVFADRANAAGMTLAGSSVVNVGADVYVPASRVSLSGTASLAVTGLLVADTLGLAGSSRVGDTAPTDGGGDQSGGGGASSTVAYAYDSLGRVASLTYPDGRVVRRSYDAAGRLASVSDGLGDTVGFGYDGDGNLISTTYPGGVVDSTVVDAADRPTAMSVTGSGGSSLASFGYSYTPGGLLASTSDSLAPQTSTDFGHDSLNRLTSVSGQQSSYGYDPSGDVVGLADGSALAYDAAGGVQSLEAPGRQVSSFGYDAVGDRTSQTGGATAAFSYDQARRLTSSSTGSGDATYAYDGDGLRASETSAAGAVSFTWDASGSLPVLLSDGSSDYVYGPSGTPVEQVGAGGAVTFLHADRLGAVRLLTSSAGGVVGSKSYDPYGNTIATTGAVTTPFGFTGQYTDPSGLIYLRARYYDPTTAGFLTPDPAYDTTHTWYTYADDDPLDAVDLSGEASYSYWFDLGSWGRPVDMFYYTWSNCAAVFPIAGCKDYFSVGQTMNLHKTYLWYTQTFPVRVTAVDGTSFSFVALNGHPEGTRRLIHFDFVTGKNGDTFLHIHTSSNGSILTNWFGIRDVDFFVARRTWESLAANIQTGYDFLVYDCGGQAVQAPGMFL